MARPVSHLLVLPPGTSRGSIVELADARFGGAHIAPNGGQWSLALTRHATLTLAGAATLDAEQANALARFFDEFSATNSPLSPSMEVFVATTLYERAGRPDFPLAHVHGVLNLFGETVPDRLERRVVDWLVAVAARLGGAVILDVSGVAGAAERSSITPQPDIAQAVTIYSPTWLTPRAAESVCRVAAPTAALVDSEHDWPGPSPDGVIVPGNPLSVDERVALHRIVDDHDIAALRAGDAIDGYAIVDELPGGSLIVVEAAAAEVLPVALRDRADLRRGCIQYRIAWEPEDPGMAHSGLFTAEIARERDLAARAISRIAHEILAAAGGFAIDEEGFSAHLRW